VTPRVSALLGAALLALWGPGLGGQTVSLGAAGVVDRLDAAWRARDAPAYLALWRFPSPEAREAEEVFLRSCWESQEAHLSLRRTAAPSSPPERPTFSGSIFTITEPRARVEQVRFHLQAGPEGWRVVERESVGQLDGLLHLSLNPAGYRADGLAIRLEDFELRMDQGTLYLSPADVGPTVLVFVGSGTVRMTPRPVPEQEQLRQFSGRPELRERVRTVFLRLHPADLHRVLTPMRLELDPEAGVRARAAQEFFADQVDQAFVLDTALPRSPWWLMPALGDALVTFRTASRGTLTYSLSQGEPESISLFDRARRRQICLYPAAGRDTRYNEDSERGIDVVHHDLDLQFQPDRYGIQGVSTIRLKMLSAASTLRLRLDESLRVASVTSPKAGELLYFRVRHQDTIMVSLGPLSGTVGEIVLTVAFAGSHRPQPVERETLQDTPDVPPLERFDADVPIEPVLVYSNRTAWYPQGPPDDHATATLRLDVPAGMLAVTGGVRASMVSEGGRTRLEYRQEQPGKYITVAVGRLQEMASRPGSPSFQAYAVARTRGQVPALLEEAAAMARFFAQEFGPCPYPNLSLVVTEGRTPGGHSPPGMVVLSLRPALLRSGLRDDPASFQDVPGFFLAHELAHQWWGQGVAGQNYRERWLSEASAQYAAALWTRHNRGEDDFRMVLGRMSRWGLRENDRGPINLGQRLGHIQGDPQIYRAVVYDKGAYVLHMIRAIVGADAFRQGLTALQARFRFGKIGTDDLREALEAASGKDLSPYFREWVYGTALPEIEYRQRVEASPGGFRTSVAVRAHNLPGPVPMEVAVAHSGGRESRMVVLPPEGATFVVETSHSPRRVEVNADRGLLARVKRR
jgi:hypothetical protein